MVSLSLCMIRQNADETVTISADSDFFIFPSQYRGYVPLDKMLYNNEHQPSNGTTNLSFRSYSFEGIAQSLSLSPHLLPFFACCVGNDQGGLKFEQVAGGYAGKVAEGRILQIARELEKLSTRPCATDDDRRVMLLLASRALLGKRDMPMDELDRLVNSASSYILPPSSSTPTPIDPLVTPAFVLSPRASDRTNQAKSRAIYNLAFSRGGIGSALLQLFRFSILSPGYGYEMTERKSTNIELGRPIRMWIYAIVQEGMGFIAIESTRTGGAMDGEVTEVVRSADRAHFAQVRIVSLEELCKAQQITLETSLPLILQPAADRLFFVLRISSLRLPTTIDFDLDMKYLPLLLALLHIQQFAKYPFTASDIRSALTTAVLLQTSPNPTDFAKRGPSLNHEKIQKSTQLVMTLYNLALLWQVLDLDRAHSFSGLFGGSLFHNLLDLGDDIERFVAGCPVEIRSVVERLSAVVMQ